MQAVCQWSFVMGCYSSLPLVWTWILAIVYLLVGAAVYLCWYICQLCLVCFLTAWSFVNPLFLCINPARTLLCLIFSHCWFAFGLNSMRWCFPKLHCQGSHYSRSSWEENECVVLFLNMSISGFTISINQLYLLLCHILSFIILLYFLVSLWSETCMTLSGCISRWWRPFFCIVQWLFLVVQTQWNHRLSLCFKCKLPFEYYESPLTQLLHVCSTMRVSGFLHFVTVGMKKPYSWRLGDCTPQAWSSL